MKRLWREQIGLSPPESQMLDVMRIAFLLEVIVGHAVALTLPNMQALLSAPSNNILEISLKVLFRFGSQSAYAFVFLSGLLVGGTLLFEFRQRALPTFTTFAAKRLMRLLPTATIALLFTAALDGFAIRILGQTEFYRNIMGHDAIAAFRPVNFLGTLFFLQPTFIDAFGSNAPLWTLGYIAQFYLCGFAILKLAQIDLRLAAAIAIVILLGFGAAKPEWSALFVVWLAGAMLRNTSLPARKTPSLIALAGTAALVTANFLPPLLSALVSGASAALLSLGSRSLASPLLKNGPLLRLIANESYTIYAVHFPALVLATMLTESIASRLLAFFLVVAAGIIATSALAHLNHRFFGLKSPKLT